MKSKLYKDFYPIKNNYRMQEFITKNDIQKILCSIEKRVHELDRLIKIKYKSNKKNETALLGNIKKDNIIHNQFLGEQIIHSKNYEEFDKLSRDYKMLMYKFVNNQLSIEDCNLLISYENNIYIHKIALKFLFACYCGFFVIVFIAFKLL